MPKKKRQVKATVANRKSTKKKVVTKKRVARSSSVSNKAVAKLSKEDLIQILDKTTGRYIKMDREGNEIAVKTTDGPYKGIEIRQRRPSKKRLAAKKKVAKKKVSKKKTTKKVATKKAAPKKKSTTVKTPAAPKKKRKVNYLNNKDMLAEVIKSKEEGKMTPKLAHMLKLLTARYGKKGNWANYTYNDDMQAYALLSLVRTWNAFKPEKSSNPFAFFTQCIKHSFIQYLNQERRQRDIRDELLVDRGMNPSYTFQMNYELQYDKERNGPGILHEEIHVEPVETSDTNLDEIAG